MELCGIEVVAVHGGTVFHDVFGGGGGVTAQRHVVAVYEIYEVVVVQSAEERALHVAERVPSHGRHLVLMTGGAEAFHHGVEYAQTIGVALIRVTAQELLAYADAQYRLCQIAYDTVQCVVAQIFHCSSGLALSGEYHTVGLSQRGGIVRQYRVCAKALECVYHRIDVSCVVFYYCNVHVYVVCRGCVWCASFSQLNIIVLLRYVSIFRSMCLVTALDRTIFSRSRPLRTRLSGVSLCVMRTTSCSMIGPASSSDVT